jgi:hypothetical protein
MGLFTLRIWRILNTIQYSQKLDITFNFIFILFHPLELSPSIPTNDISDIWQQAWLNFTYQITLRIPQPTTPKLQTTTQLTHFISRIHCFHQTLYQQIGICILRRIHILYTAHTYIHYSDELPKDTRSTYNTKAINKCCIIIFDYIYTSTYIQTRPS